MSIYGIGGSGISKKRTVYVTFILDGTEQN